MTDIALVLTENSFDVEIQESDLMPDEGLETAVAISLFSDRRVSDEQLPDFETDKRGYWGDAFPEVDKDKIGSRLWTMDRSKVLTETPRRSEELCKEALEWMKEDGIAGEITINSEYNESKHMTTEIQISRTEGEVIRFEVLWDQQKLRR